MKNIAKKPLGGGDDGGRKNKKGGGKQKNAISTFGDAIRKKVSVLLSTSVERFGVFRLRDFFSYIPNKFKNTFLNK